ncbi:MAG TPA: hypothetical protein VFS13_02105 [Steroidobacteraceae bacterium]|nr:hypothetical protein [Steroidobacteraceae bacterium]
MRTREMILGLTLAIMLASCGGPGPGAPGAKNAGERKPPSGAATAEQVAEEARGDVDCPADIETPARRADAPVDDVVGVRPGLTFDEAANVVMCTSDMLVVTPDTSARFNINTYGSTLRQGFSARFAEPRVVKDSRDYMREMSEEFAARSGNAVREDMKPGQSKWYVSTMGVPGSERVIAAAREEWFAEGRNPTMQSVAEALIKKYGEPTRRQEMPQQIMLTWIHDPQGRFVPDTSPMAMRCTPMSDPDGGTNFSPDCGVVVAARVDPVRENPALARSLSVGVADQSGGYELITQTEQALQSGEMKRRQQEVENAAQNADQPQL